MRGRWRVDGGRQRVVMNGTTALWTTLYEQTIRMTFLISFESTGGMGRVGKLQKVSMIERDAYAVKGNVESKKCTYLTFSFDFFFHILHTIDIRHSCSYDEVN